MGFPTIYYCVILPTPLVVLLQILDLIRLSLSTALGFVGVRCPLLELPALPPPPPSPQSSSSLLDRLADDTAPDAFAYDRLYPLSDISSHLPSPSSIKRRLPVVRFAALRRSSAAAPPAAVVDACEEAPVCCPICLCGLEARHQVRLLDNCRHVFHKDCIDRWVDQGQSTCPLCRSRLLMSTRCRAREPGERDVDVVRHRSSSSWLADSVSSLFRGYADDDDSPYPVAQPPSATSSLLIRGLNH